MGLTMPLPEISGAEPGGGGGSQRNKSGDRKTRGDGGRLTVDGLIDAVALALAVGDPAQTGTGEETDAAGDDRGLVADDIPKQVAGDDNAVEAAGVLDHDHGRAVDELVVNLELGVFLGKHVRDRLAPETTSRQHVGLVQAPDLCRRVAGEREGGAEAGDALNLGAAVGLRIHGEAAAVVLGAVAKVDAARQLADDGEVGPAAHFGLEGREVDERLGREAAGAQVAVGPELLAELQDALLGADGGRGAPFRAADGAEEDGVGLLGGVEGLVGEGVPVRIDRGLWRGGAARGPCQQPCLREKGGGRTAGLRIGSRRRTQHRMNGARLTPPKR